MCQPQCCGPGRLRPLRLADAVHMVAPTVYLFSRGVSGGGWEAGSLFQVLALSTVVISRHHQRVLVLLLNKR